MCSITFFVLVTYCFQLCIDFLGGFFSNFITLSSKHLGMMCAIFLFIYSEKAARFQWQTVQIFVR